MAHKKGGGSSTNGRDSNAQRLGVKAFAGELITGGSIIIRQRGTKIKPGVNVGIGSDDTLFAKVTGRVKCSRSNPHQHRGTFAKSSRNKLIQEKPCFCPSFRMCRKGGVPKARILKRRPKLMLEVR